jgi:sugar lactone lactonase YvrE
MKHVLKITSIFIVMFYTMGCSKKSSNENPTPSSFSRNTSSTTSPSDDKVSTLAGSGTAGCTNGTGTSAQFNCPSGIAVDSQGCVYVADRTNHCIRKVTSTGVVTTLAGSCTKGYADGNCTQAQFNCPSGVAVDKNGNVYVADQGNNCIRKISCTGDVTTLAGSCTSKGSNDGVCGAAQFNFPTGITVDKNCNVYVADQCNNRIRKITPDGVVTTVAGSTEGFNNGYCYAAQFHNTTALACDANDNIYVVDQFNYLVRKIAPSGTVSTYSCAPQSSGSNDQGGNSTSFGSPCGIAVDANNNIYVADQTNQHIHKITPSGTVSSYSCPGVQNNTDPTYSSQISVPCGLTADGAGNVYVADYSGQCIHKISCK